MGADTKGFVMTEQKNAFEVAQKVVDAIESLMTRTNHDWRRSSIVNKARGKTHSLLASYSQPVK